MSYLNNKNDLSALRLAYHQAIESDFADLRMAYRLVCVEDEQYLKQLERLRLENKQKYKNKTNHTLLQNLCASMPLKWTPWIRKHQRLAASLLAASLLLVFGTVFGIQGICNGLSSTTSVEKVSEDAPLGFMAIANEPLSPQAGLSKNAKDKTDLLQKASSNSFSQSVEPPVITPVTDFSGPIQFQSSFVPHFDEPTGRHDPFGSLEVSPVEGKPKKRDIIQEDLQFVGFIGDVKTKDKLAILHITEPFSDQPQTLLQKVGSRFFLEGNPVFLTRISRSEIRVKYQGKLRSVALVPYVDTTTVNAATSGTPASGGVRLNAPGSQSSPVYPHPAQVNRTFSSHYPNLGALSQPTTPTLQEPGP